MKICSWCNESKPLDDFSWKNKSKGTKSANCKSCQSNYAKTHYESNKGKYLSKSKVSNKKAVDQNREFLKEYLQNNPCVDCGYSDIRALQFDHKIPLNDSKAPRVPHMLRCSLEKIKEEISKCDVRCANCHVIRTRNQLGWNNYD